MQRRNRYQEIRHQFLSKSAVLADNFYSKVSNSEVNFSYRHYFIQLSLVIESSEYYLICVVDLGINVYRTEDIPLDGMLADLTDHDLKIFIDSCIDINNSLSNIKDAVMKVSGGFFKWWYRCYPVRDQIIIADDMDITLMSNYIGEYGIHIYITVSTPRNKPASVVLLCGFTDSDDISPSIFKNHIEKLTTDNLDTIIDSCRANLYSEFAKHTKDINLLCQMMGEFS